MTAAARPAASPRATYRLQLRQGLGFEEARAVLPYLAGLGISHVYASPFLTARPGSTHGYDIVDFNRIDPALGGEAAFDRFVEMLQAHGMGLILDFVPNHMGIGGAENAWWLDVLEWGRNSPYAHFFDIDWAPATANLRGKVLLPLLGDHYGAVLDSGQLQLRFDADAGAFSVWYHEHRLPIGLQDYGGILHLAADLRPDAGDPLSPLLEGFKGFDGRRRSRPQQAEIRREAEELRARLARLSKGSAAVAAAIEAAVRRLTATPGRPEGAKALHELLERQAYRVAFWRVADDEINYRRFFDINELAGLRVEQADVFEASHGLVFRLIAEGKLQGLRLDHIDGLYDPRAYCLRLQRRAAELAPAAPGPRSRRRPFYLLVEKILGQGERLPENWPVQGTTGYEFMNLVNGLFVDPAGKSPLAAAYDRFVGGAEPFAKTLRAAKRRILDNNLASEVNALALQVYRLAQQDRKSRDHTQTRIRGALVETFTQLPVYRTYVDGRGIGETDRRRLDAAVDRARRAARDPDPSVYDFLHACLTTDLSKRSGRGYRRTDIRRVAMRAQQVSGPVMAKAFEDTALYRYHRLVSLNEVGGEPERFGVSPADFHLANRERWLRTPFSLLATATHDHKRGEDTRARIDVLSEIPEDWDRRARRWAELNAPQRRSVDGEAAPDPNDEYLLYQTLVGAWPLELAIDDHDGLDGLAGFAERVAAYMTKAMREAKQRTSWTAVNPAYEEAVEAFVRAIMSPSESPEFLTDLCAFQQAIGPTAAINGLAQALLKLTVPGVPDTYQGSEFWDQSLVDPDNRQPVDYGARSAAAAAAADHGPPPPDLLAGWQDGRIKQWLVRRVLGLRARQPELFTEADYIPLETQGPQADRIVAFLRQGDGAALLVVVPRLAFPLLEKGPGLRFSAEAWRDTVIALPEMPEGLAWQDALSGGPCSVGPERACPIAALFADLPVALRHGKPAAGA